MAHPKPFSPNCIHNYPLTSIALHVHTANPMCYLNTVFLEGFKLAPSNLNVQLIEHHHPLNNVAEFPFGIVNGKHILAKDAIIKLLISLVDLSQVNALMPNDYSESRGQQIGENVFIGEQERPIQPEIDSNSFKRDHGFKLSIISLFRMCEELSQLASILSEDDTNSYYMLFSPIKKWKMSLQIQKERQDLIERTNLINQQDEINTEEVLYRLDQISKYYVGSLLREKRYFIRSFMKIIMTALVKQFKINHQPLHQVAMRDQEFKTVEETTIEFKKAIHENLTERRGRHENIVMVLADLQMERLDSVQSEVKAEEYEHYSEKVMRWLFKPIATTSIFLLLYKLLQHEKVV